MGKKVSEKGAVTDWKPQSDGQMRTRKESEEVKDTHSLERAGQRTDEERERK